MIPIHLLGLHSDVRGSRQQQQRGGGGSRSPHRPAPPPQAPSRSDQARTRSVSSGSRPSGPVVTERGSSTHRTETSPDQRNFGSFKEGFSSGMNFLKRRFSSSDLVDDVGSEGGAPPGSGPGPGTGGGRARASPSPAAPPPAGYANRPDQSGFSLQGLSNKMSSTISAPTSPAKGHGGSMYSQVQGLTKNIFQAATGQKQPGKEHSKALLVIDDQHTDWSKYFRNKKILGDWEVRVEQAEFSEISLAAFSDSGCIVDLNMIRGGANVNRSFVPDFVLVRQPVKTSSADWRRIIVGLLYGGVPSLNSLHSIYNFIDKPWVFAHLLMIQRRLGKEKFPLIDQAFYPGFRQMSPSPKYPVVVKVGHGQKGVGKIKINDPTEFQDISSVVGVASSHCTVEPFVDSKYDVHVQKIGPHYKAFMRKGISGHWKANLGSAMLEQIALTDRCKQWVDEVTQLFGGLDICSVEAIVAKDGAEIIYEVNDCSFTLLGETQEEDRRQIADLVLQKMNHILGVRQALTKRESIPSTAPTNFIKHETPVYNQEASPSRPPPANPPRPTQPPPPQPPPPHNHPPPPHPEKSQGVSNQNKPAGAQPVHSNNPFLNQAQPPAAAPPPLQPQGGGPGPGGISRAPPPRPPRLPSQSSKDVPMGAPQSQAPGIPKSASQTSQGSDGVPPGGPVRQGSTQGEDTMTNLRKTFAGIFGDM